MQHHNGRLRRYRWRRLLLAATGVLPTLFWVLILFSFDTPAVATATLLCALLHEGGHTLAFLLLGRQPPTLCGVLTGFRLRTDALLSYPEELAVAAAGPLASGVGAALSLMLPALSRDYRVTLALLNLGTMVGNLIPISGYDGYRILSAALGAIRHDGSGEGVLRAVSTACTALLALLSLLLIEYANTGYWIFAVLFAILLRELAGGLDRKKREKER